MNKNSENGLKCHGKNWWMHFLMLAVGLKAIGLASAAPNVSPPAATIVVATKDSSERSKASADFVGDGTGDQEEINAAVRALPKPGGKVLLMEGTYDIRIIEGQLGGVILDRSNVVLAGQGPSTKLIQAADQNVNVIRIIGSGVGHITIEDLCVDANREQNSKGQGDPNLSHDRFEFCGIKAYYRKPGGPAGLPNHNITIRNSQVRNAHRLGIMLEGENMKVLNNVLGNAGSDAVEILTGPGEIRGNYVEITGRTHVAIGSDRANSIIMADNIVHVKRGGELDIGFRSWAASRRHVIVNNVLTVEPEGRCGLAMDVRGTGAVVSGNALHSSDATNRMRLLISGGNTVLTGNLLENVVIEIYDQTGEKKSILVRDNLMENSTIDHKKGNLITAAGSESATKSR